MNNNLLKLEKITKNFGNVEVLKEVSLTIDKGEVKIPLFAIAEYAEVISIGITSETPRAMASTARIDVDKSNLLAVLRTFCGETNSCTILTEIKFNDLRKPSLKVVKSPVDPS